jgi:hypothetical protein
LIRFQGGLDMTMPVRAGFMIHGDPWKEETVEILDRPDKGLKGQFHRFSASRRQTWWLLRHLSFIVMRLMLRHDGPFRLPT